MINDMKDDLECDQKKNLSFYVYLLMDPKIWRDLPIEWENSADHEHRIWRRFLESIFYVGKGTGDRVNAHTKEAKNHEQELKLKDWSNVSSEGTEKLVKFYRDQRGVLSLTALNEFIRKEDLGDVVAMLCTMANHLKIRENNFQKVDRILEIGTRNVISKRIVEGVGDVEALTCEAAIIDALSLRHLTNAKSGSMKIKSDKRGEWTVEKKKRLGIELLREAFKRILDADKVPFRVQVY